ncbi:MAG: hypothetical protein ABH823_03810 [bacterium]
MTSALSGPSVARKAFGLISRVHVDPGVKFESVWDRLRLSPGVMIKGNVTIKKGTRIGANTLIQAFPGKALVLEGNIGSNSTIQARKEDTFLTGNVVVEKGAFVKDLQLEDMAEVRLGAYSEVKKVKGQGARLVVGERAFYKNNTVADVVIVTSFTRVDGEKTVVGRDSFEVEDRLMVERFKTETAQSIARAMEKDWRNLRLLLERTRAGLLHSLRNVFIGSNVTLGEGTVTYAGVKIVGEGEVIIGQNNTFHSGVTILAQRGTTVVIGDNNTFFGNTTVFSRFKDVEIGSNNEEIGIGGGALVLDSSIGDNVFLVGNPVINNSILGGNNFVFRSLLESVSLARGEDEEIEVKSNCVVRGHSFARITVDETVPEGTKIEQVE